MEQREIVLASSSPRRRDLLLQIGVCPVIIPSRIKEESRETDPARMVMDLSRQKAEDVAGRLAEESRIILGADTVVFAGGRVLGKPKTGDEAAAMLGLLAGGSHRVFTGVTLLKGAGRITFYEETEVFVYPMTRNEISDYAASGESMDKAGAYGIQGRFAAHIKEIRGSYTNVMGLPAGRVYQELKRLMEAQND